MRLTGRAPLLCLLAVVPALAGGVELPRKTIEAKRIETAPVLDGVLDDAAWRQAPWIEDLHVVVSDEFAEPPERSRVYVAFDDQAIYFAARFWDREPDKVVAKVLRKTDASFGEDGFSVTLDPFDQGRSGYMFDVNPNGLRSEALYTDVDRQNWDWEAIWDASARRDAEGWTAEMAIPLKTLSFDPGRDAWGVNFTRWVGRHNEQFGWVSRNRTQDLSRSGRLAGLAGLRQGRGLDVIPGVRASASRDHQTGRDDSALEPSLDAFWKPTPSLTAALTLNPDFSGTTADTRQINLTRFDLFFPEQRAFFLQDADIFEFGRLEEEDGLPFFSRRIGLDDDGRPLALDAGVKLTGRAGPWNIGVLGVRQDSAAGPGAENLFVGRIATHVLAESVAGAIVTSGSPDGGDNSLAGLDFRYLNTRLGDGRVLEATAWYQETRTPGAGNDDAAFGASIGMPSAAGWSGEASFKTLERDYFPALGFASRTDVRELELEMGYRWRPAASRLRALYAGAEVERIRSIAGADESREIELTLIEVENQTADVLAVSALLLEERLTEPFEISDGVVIPAGTYSFDHACATLATGAHRDVAAESTVCQGEFYDGSIRSMETRTTWRPSAHLKLTLAAEYNDVDLPQGDFITRLWGLNLDVAFNIAWSWENFVQYDNVSETVGVNSILRWIPRAGRETVLAVNSRLDDLDGDRRFHSASSDVTVKVSYTLRF